jgi:predicted dehydrogenase/threonine dehydrogenase-like Zn-dependent dehydrogenase
MKQLIQDLKTGELRVEEVPPPALRASGVLVRNCYSLISAGTERVSVSAAQTSLLSRARTSPELVNKMLQNIKREGISTVYQRVMNRLGMPKTLGYSSAGVVIARSPDIDDLKPGDRVACAGEGYASHAEVVFVPKNLCVPIPHNVGFKEAAFTTLGAIALQGVRQAEVSPGGYVAVLGLGLVGLLTVQILKAFGCRVIGFDISQDALVLSQQLGADLTIHSTDPDAEEMVANFTGGFGTDQAIITAASTSNQPVELAGRVSRDRATVVIVGAVRVDVPRKHYYEKELNLKFSRSYGPGRYDPIYEVQGIDYPVGYVRWTEGRNMLAFLQLVMAGKIQPEKLVTHTFSIENASKAYEIITGKVHEKYLGILLEYESKSTSNNGLQLQTRLHLKKDMASAILTHHQVNVGFIGAGNFAQNHLLPTIKDIKGIQLQGVATARGVSARAVGAKFGFTFCTSDSLQIIEDPSTDCIFITTRHNLHAELVVKALKQHKHVFVEKPLALSEDELTQIIAAYSDSRGELMVGYNRRFSPLMKETKEFFRPLQKPLVIHYRVNAGLIPKKHWSQDPIEGGGRIIGEVCHFIDTIQFLTDAEPVEVYALSTSSTNSSILDSDNVNISIRMSDGSIGIITYTTLGDVSLGKERIEAFCGSSSIVINDFVDVIFYRDGKSNRVKGKGKGIFEELKIFLDGVKNGEPSPIPFKSLIQTSLVTFSIKKSLDKNSPVSIQSSNECIGGFSE